MRSSWASSSRQCAASSSCSLCELGFGFLIGLSLAFLFLLGLAAVHFRMSVFDFPKLQPQAACRDLLLQLLDGIERVRADVAFAAEALPEALADCLGTSLA